MKKWTSTLDNITEQFIAQFGTLTNDQMNWKPNPNTWSIAQNLDHLIVVNETYYPVLSALKEGKYKTPFIAKIGFIVSCALVSCPHCQLWQGHRRSHHRDDDLRLLPNRP